VELFSALVIVGGALISGTGVSDHVDRDGSYARPRKRGEREEVTATIVP
jgi:hypothetical protein